MFLYNIIVSSMFCNGETVTGWPAIYAGYVIILKVFDLTYFVVSLRKEDFQLSYSAKSASDPFALFKTPLTESTDSIYKIETARSVSCEEEF